MHDVTRKAVADYTERNGTRELVEGALDDLLARYPETLRRLGE